MKKIVKYLQIEVLILVLAFYCSYIFANTVSDSKVVSTNRIFTDSLVIKKNPLDVFKIELTENSLKRFPEYIRECKNLHSLIISAKITNIPDWITELKNLDTLELENNNIKRIPLSICNLKNIKLLSFQGNIGIIIPTEISMLSNLSSLNISNCGFKIIPTEILKSNLKTLYI